MNVVLYVSLHLLTTVAGMSLVETVASKASQTNSFVLHPGLSLDSTLFNGLGPGYYLYMPLLYYVYNSPLFDEVLRVELGTRQMKFLYMRTSLQSPSRKYRRCQVRSQEGA